VGSLGFLYKGGGVLEGQLHVYNLKGIDFFRKKIIIFER